MFRLTGQLPKEIYLACSGGVDSMVALHFLRHGCRDVIPLYFNHGTEFGDKCEAFLKSLDVDVICGKITKEKEKGMILFLILLRVYLFSLLDGSSRYLRLFLFA